jgi:rhodanese-related sulfurtransferase
MKHSPGFLKLVANARKRIREISVRDVKRKLATHEDFLLIDIREEHEWAEGHIAGATYSGRGILERDIEARFPDKKKEIVLYCGGGFRSALSAESLQKMGYRNVFSMAGGWRAWKKARGKVER